MGNTSTKRVMGLAKFTQIYHKILPFFLSIWDRSSEPGKSNDTLPKGNVDARERKGKESLYSRKVQDLEGLDEKKEEAQERNYRYKQRMTKAYGRIIKERLFIKG